MCGFAGFSLAAGQVTEHPDALLQAMGERLRHRGPDGGGVWFNRDAGVGFAHRRLAIQDISPSGAQPMHSASGRYVIAFNGEIYNFMELARELAGFGVVFRGHSDTEVMLACFDRWGVRESLDRFEGMFAFAVLDRETRHLYLARDRLGEKPLYYGFGRFGTLLFASELAALRCHPHFDDEIDRDALALLLKHNYIPAPYSIYQSIHKLEPASLLTLELGQRQMQPRVERYWEIGDYYAQDELDAGRDEIAVQLGGLLERSVRQQMISDVPLGAFLSGGVDSSAVVALMQSQSDRPVKTFSIGFQEEGYNEAGYAAAVARHLGTDHTELYLQASDALDVVECIPAIYDEPFADSSQIPTYLVSKMAREHVTVALSGDGGDELFCGYQRYFDYVRDWRRLQHGGSHKLLQQILLNAVPHALLATLAGLLLPGQRGISTSALRDKLARRAGVLSASTLQDYYDGKLAYWTSPASLVKGARVVSTALANSPAGKLIEDEYRQLMLLDSVSYLPDDIMAKVDRAAMANSLETRIPFLNHTVVEFAARIPSRMLTDGTTGKLVLRDILYRHVPRELIERPKAGFAVPVASWLRTSLRDWACDLLGRDRLEAQGYFEADVIAARLQDHLDGKADYSFQLWGVLGFQAWQEHLASGQVSD